MSDTREDIEPVAAEATGSRAGTPPPSTATDTLALARDHLLSLQSPAGWWKGELETNVTMDAEDMLLREFLGIRSDEVSARQAAWIRSQQRADGTWANFAGGPGDLSTTIESYVALRLAGDDPAAGTCAARRRSCAAPAVCRRRACSPGSGWRCSAPGAGTTSPRCCPSRSCCRSGSRSTSTTSPAGRARPSSPSRPCSRCARCGRCRSRSPSSTGQTRSRRRPARRRWPRRSSRSTRCSSAISASRSTTCGSCRCSASGAGSSTAKRSTAAGAASSRRGSTR